LMTTSFNVATAVNRATGFEVLAAATPSSLDASSFTGINEFVFTSNSGNLNITGVESNDRFVLAGDIRGSDDAVRFTGKNAGSSVVFEMRASAATNGEVTIISQSNSGNDSGAIGFRNGISSVTIDSTGTNANANLIEAVRTGNYNFYALNNDNGLSNFKITGSQNLTIEAREGVDLSTSSRTIGFQNAVNVDASSFTGVLRISGSNSNDVIAGGSGNDIIYGLKGSDTLTGNGGSDQFRFVGFSETDIIRDFTKGEDKIGSNNLDFANTTATSAGATLSAQDYVDNRASISNIGTGDDKKVIELQSALSTTQIQTDTGGAAAAYLLVFNSTTNKGELWFDSNWSTTGRSQVATFDNITSLAELTGFKNTDFVEFIA
jgi:Ca2+-binding RTX toxin-like protein